MPEVPGIREVSTQRPSYVNQVADLTKGLNITEKGAALVKEVVGLMGSDRAVRITNTPMTKTGEVGTAAGPTGVPVLDSPDDAKAKEVNLAKLVAYLQLDNDERQASQAQERIDGQKNTLQSRHKEQMDKLKESLKKMDKAAKAKKAHKLFGWLMAVVSVVVAVAASVATGGLAVGPMVGAMLAIGMCVLNETEAMDKLTDAIANGLEKLGVKKDIAKAIAQVAIAVAMMVAAIACGGAGIGNIANETAETVMKAALVAMKIMGVASMITGGVNTGLSYSAGKAQAKLLETEKFLTMMRQAMEETQDELQKILEQIQNVYSAIVDILSSQTDTMDDIAKHIGNMA